MPTPDLEAKMREAKILLYEDMWQSRYVKQALDAMGLPYVDVVDRAGDFKAQLLSGTNWDLIITAIEARSVVQGEFFVYLNENLNKGSSLILEIWNLDDIWAGQVSTLLTRCGVQFQADWWDPPQRSIWWLASEHPVLHEPNDGISLVHYQEFWPGDAGDLLRKAPGGDAVMLAGIYATEKTSYATLVTCVDGRMIIQTHSTHDFKPTDIIPLWQNYIYNTLRARFLLSGEDEGVRPDAHFVPIGKERFTIHPLMVDEHAIRAAQIFYPETSSHPFDYRVVATYLRMI
jgi:hypothetical protein